MLEVVPPAVLEAHHVQAERGGTAPVEHRIALLGESRLLGLALDAPPLCERLEDVERRGLAQEGEDDHVEHEEEQIAVALLVSRLEALCRARDEVLQRALYGVLGRERVEDDLALGHAVREHEERCDRVVFRRADEEVPVEVGEHKDERELQRRRRCGHPAEREQVLDETLRAVDLVVLALAGRARVLARLGGRRGARGGGGDGILASCRCGCSETVGDSRIGGSHRAHWRSEALVRRPRRKREHVSFRLRASWAAVSRSTETT
ncbi:hypothetical protein L1887_55084 [Cichorium endivia]|nr:hypothetical protein L1887_55084 [Cichorium endivia]